MEIHVVSYPLENDTASASPCALAIGHFDGVHLGHRSVIDRAVAKARESGLRAAVMTFNPHPREVLGRGGGYAASLTPLQDKLELFREAGADTVYVMRFDPAFAEISPRTFVDEVLLRLGVKHAVVGFDFRFGRFGEGTADGLRELGADDFGVDVIPAQSREGLKVSSTYVREALENGQVELAAELLGRPYSVSGVVVHGDARGRTIGFPTANVQQDESYVVPRLGVYAVRVHLPAADGREAQVRAAVLNHGMKPTFNKEKIVPVLEAHLLDFEGDLYGNRVRIEFLHFLRAERKFNGIAELVEQLGKDRDRAAELLNA
ncbi:bifunctional riboflavin kinase/FAD synthetase [Paenibacillus pasadenensis]|uniref:bifunctional riboflavin kinase/FAD synthetase n=1 Tax=Paenibacillus pasadenensis TaxID=217090 RepID=UPI00203D056B|nr:bifunctional riboflavin kinase/FAD synthetase [Paenibacillus pasadenensis]